MQAVLLVFAARFRRGWRSWLLLSLLVALVAGVAMAAATAGRRAASAFPRYVAAHGFDAAVYTVKPLPALAGLPEVRQSVPGYLPFSGPVSCGCGRPLSQVNLAIRVLSSAGGLGEVVKVVSGRLPTAPDEVLVSYNMAPGDVRVGTVLRTRLEAPAQAQAALASLAGKPAPKPAGDVVSLRVTGIGVAEYEFPSGGPPSRDIYASQAFTAAHPGLPGLKIYYLRFRHGAADLRRFEARADLLRDAGVQDLGRPTAAIAASIRPQATGWWVLCGLAVLAGLAVVGQALARQAAAEDTDYVTLAAIGVRPGQLAAVSLGRAVTAGVAGALAGAGLAFALSPFAPAGEARLADPEPGLFADWPVLAAGAGIAVVVTAALAVLPALRSARTRARSQPGPEYRASVVVQALASAGAPPSAVIGTRRALQSGRGRDGRGPAATGTVPVGTALAGTAAAVAALCATAVFGASLGHLTSSPALYGAPFQLYFVSSGVGGQDESSLLTEFRHDPGLAQITLGRDPSLTVNGVSVRGLATSEIRGPVLMSAASGRVPAGSREIGLGATTLRQTGARIGGTVRVTLTSPGGFSRTVPFTVTGVVPFPSDLGTGGIGTGAAMTLAAYDDALCPGPATSAAACRHKAEGGLGSVILLRGAPGAAGAAAVARHVRLHPDDAYRTQLPTALASFGESANFPLLLGAILVLCGVATLAHLLAVSVRRRRRENGLLSSLGFVRRQLAGTMFWQASTVAVTGLVVGVPLGLVAGHVIWRAFAANLGVVPVAVLPAGLITLLAAGVLAAANLIAVLPAVAAGRTLPGPALRSE